MCGMNSMTSVLKVFMILDNFISVRRNMKINDIFKKQIKKKPKKEKKTRLKTRGLWATSLT